MKKILCITLLASNPVTMLQHAVAKDNIQLPKQVLSAQSNEHMPAHLTTRLEWRQFPKPAYHNDDLQGQDRAAVVRVVADSKGQIKQATIQDSTGITPLDQLLVNAVKNASLKPHLEDGNAAPTIGYQVFEMKIKAMQQSDCQYHFQSKIWQAQHRGEKTKFRYVQQPQLTIDPDLLQGHDRQIQFSIKTNVKGQAKQVKIIQGSGVYSLDQKLIQSIQGIQIESKRVASTLWVYKPSTFKDEIHFNRTQCH